MSPLTWNRARALALVAGAMDFGTGLGLVAMPVGTLACMGLAAPGAEALIFLRWVGVFVGAVGASYLAALLGGGTARLRAVFEFTLLFRTGAGGYCGAMVLLGALEPRWFAVTATDLGLVVAQVWLLRKGGWSDD